MARDVYSIYADLYEDKYLKKKAYSNFIVPEISLAGATIYYIPPEYQYRPDLISYNAYGTIDFEDFVVFANKFGDPIKDFYSGRKIYLPNIEVLIDVIQSAV